MTSTSPPHEEQPPEVGGTPGEGTSIPGDAKTENSTASGGAELEQVAPVEEGRSNPQPSSEAMSKGSEEETGGRGGGSGETTEDCVQVEVGKCFKILFRATT